MKKKKQFRTPDEIIRSGSRHWLSLQQTQVSMSIPGMGFMRSSEPTLTSIAAVRREWMQYDSYMTEPCMEVVRV